MYSTVYYDMQTYTKKSVSMPVRTKKATQISIKKSQTADYLNLQRSTTWLPSSDTGAPGTTSGCRRTSSRNRAAEGTISTSPSRPTYKSGKTSRYGPDIRRSPSGANTATC